METKLQQKRIEITQSEIEKFEKSRRQQNAIMKRFVYISLIIGIVLLLAIVLFITLSDNMSRDIRVFSEYLAIYAGIVSVLAAFLIKEKNNVKTKDHNTFISYTKHE